jgi:MFS family permease
MSATQQGLAATMDLTDAPVDSSGRRALTASAVGYAMDGFDLLILGFMLRAISADLHLTPPQAGSLITWTLIGAVVGGVLFGILSDYYGRVKVLTWTILLFAIFTGLGALAQGYWDLLIYRTIAGVGLGGEFGIGMALVAEPGPPGSVHAGVLMLHSAGRPGFCSRRLRHRCCCQSSAGEACSSSA